MSDANWKRGVRGWIRLVVVGATLATCCGMLGCQTTKGVGRDIENLGDNIEDAAEEND